MSDRLQSTLTDPPPHGIFRQSGLLVFPAPWRPALHDLGSRLFDMALESFGFTPEHRNSLDTSTEQIAALRGDVITSAQQLRQLSREAGTTDMTEAEMRLCRRAGEIAPQLESVAEALGASIHEARRGV